MSRRLIAALMMTGLAASLSAATIDDLTNEISRQIFGPISASVSRQFADHMGFYAGSGNMTAVNTSPFLGLKCGAGIGFVFSYISRKGIFENDFSALTNGVSGSNVNTVTNLARGLSLIPLPYDMVYLKMGLPVIPLDLGFRFGFYPTVSRDGTNGTSLDFKAGYAGVEARYLLAEYYGGLLKIDARLSLDYNGGLLALSYGLNGDAFVSNTLVGTNAATTGFKIDWAGFTIGTKVMAGVNLGWIGGAFAGLGVDVNLGRVITETYMEGVFTDLIGTQFPIGVGQTVTEYYKPLEVRLLFGLQLLFVSASFEYGFVSRDLSLNIFPLALAF